MSTPASRRIDRLEYERMIDAGVFSPDDKLELIEGELVAMHPQHGRHAMVTLVVQQALARAFGAGFHVRSQVPLALGNDSEPEPDVAVVVGAPRDYPDHHPTTAVLVVEVADSSLEFDRGRKAGIYGRAGIPEYWVVNLVDDVIEVQRDPCPTGYRTRALVRRGTSVSPLGARGVAVAATEILP